MFILLGSIYLRGATCVNCLSSRSFVRVIFPLAALTLIRVGVPAVAGLMPEESAFSTLRLALEFALEGIVIHALANLAKLLRGRGAILIVGVAGDAVGERGFLVVAFEG